MILIFREQTLEQLKALKLEGMAAMYETMVQRTTANNKATISLYNVSSAGRARVISAKE
jgi:hypothetical protein